MIKYIVILAAVVFILPGMSYGAHTISGAEYYFDYDPGEGKGTPLNPEDGSFNSDFETTDMEITLPNLTIGPHFLYVRMKNEEGVWASAENTCS